MRILDSLQVLQLKIILACKHLRYPKNIWYGGSISREDALGSVGKGWSKLINNIYDAKPKHTKIVTVKEKFAELRVYSTHSPNWFEDLISYYAYRSGTTCEQCGAPSKVRLIEGWYFTLCDKCNEEKNRTKK